jgi:superfamily II DNA or RNA helicase
VNQSETFFAPIVSPSGRLHFVTGVGGAPASSDLHARLTSAFDRGQGHGLFHLGATEVATFLPAPLAFWRDFAAQYVTALCAAPSGSSIAVDRPDPTSLAWRLFDVPPMTGAEYVTEDVMLRLWDEMHQACQLELRESGLELPEFLKALHPGWNLVGRVHFHLAEDRKNPDAPFAFLATYSSRLSTTGKAQHVPLAKAMQEFAGAGSKNQLLSLLQPVQRAAQACAWLRELVESGQLYQRLAWSPSEAWTMLSDVANLKAAGIVVRAPGHWHGGRPKRATVQANIGAKPPSVLGLDALLDFDVGITLDGESLTPSERKALLSGVDGLQLIRGQWVEVDKRQLSRLLDRFEDIEKAAARGGISFAEAMRLVSGVALDDGADAKDVEWARVCTGAWLEDTLARLRTPDSLVAVDPGQDLKATLRPYQTDGVRWLYLLTQLRMGACLADDMGLGKTMQVLALLLILAREGAQSKQPPSLLVAPSSLLANWEAEAAKFAPSLRVQVLHTSMMPLEQIRGISADALAQVDLAITSYTMLLRIDALQEVDWRLVVADEAQAIKNPSAQVTRRIKTLKAVTRIALTGTPVENRLSDLYSLFDFTHPGLLGTPKQFTAFTKRFERGEHYGPLRKLVQPYILRRLKTDKKVIADLPLKTELMAWCSLTKTQAALYEKGVEEFSQLLAEKRGMERRGMILAYMMRFKQICNHTSQWLGDGAWDEAGSGKYARLRELAEVVAAKQEKMLVFTQFRQTIEPLAAFLGSIFGRQGLVLHGGTPVAQRRSLVNQFQDDELTPFFVISLKAGGSGLNLTAASHVVHFDRWWNPAVENQATDRAFRIGQKRNVLVHKFVCRGTIEEKIDALIESKKKLVFDVLEGEEEIRLTEMSDRELLELVKLDIRAIEQG